MQQLMRKTETGPYVAACVSLSRVAEYTKGDKSK